jgi:hypothetical protein
MLDSFIRHVNAAREWTGLEAIPAGKVRPHMFRRTMAMLTDQFAGSEIALRIQLKHVATRALANCCTRGSAASDAAWAEHLDSALKPSASAAWKTSTRHTKPAVRSATDPPPSAWRRHSKAFKRL